MMDRRTFVRAVAGGLLAAPFEAVPQQPVSLPRVVVLFPGTTAPLSSAVATFKREMLDRGYVEGKNVLVEIRWADGKTERLPGIAADLVALRPAVIVAIGSEATHAVAQATTTIPIVMSLVGDPVGSGFVEDLARPGRNVTGVTDFGVEIVSKHLELIHSLVPGARRVGVLMSDNPTHPRQFRVIEDAAKTVGLTVVPAMQGASDNLESVFALLARENAKALVVLGGAQQTSQRVAIAKLAVEARLPTIAPIRAYVVDGALLSYGPSLVDNYKRTAAYVDRILKGAKPADLPVEQPTVFNMTVNMKTAKALNLTIPQSLLLRADEVIQ